MSNAMRNGPIAKCRDELLAWMATRPPMTANEMIAAGVLEDLNISARENLVTRLCEMCKLPNCPISAYQVPEHHLYRGQFTRRGWVNVYRIEGVHI